MSDTPRAMWREHLGTEQFLQFTPHFLRPRAGHPPLPTGNPVYRHQTHQLPVLPCLQCTTRAPGPAGAGAAQSGTASTALPRPARATSCLLVLCLKKGREGGFSVCPRCLYLSMFVRLVRFLFCWEFQPNTKKIYGNTSPQELV